MSVMISSLLIIFLLCFSMHTCNARHLAGAMDDKAAASHEKLLFSSKVLESAELKEEDSISVEKRTSEDGVVFHQSHDHETSTVVKPKDSEDYLGEKRQNRGMSSVPVPRKKGLVSDSDSGRVLARKNYYDERTEKFKPSTHVGLLRPTSIIEGSRRRELPSSEIEGSDYKKVNKEDASSMDYDPPHQKPPIHNGET